MLGFLRQPNLPCWDQFAESAGLGRARTRKRILELAQSLPKTARQLQSQKELGFAENPLVEQIITLIEQRAVLTIRRLTEPQGDA